ncbi:hypothetical protein ACRE_019290 [Hapsidospora chrysogenum ATCC 11550]|uniref:BZIP domain-containing protein n=1 Tax=Hapsidospora chrysogenum (strain ATCC 11550 / CBS 779.69 / DSM 880 / IAM 14645 / JCM 23072 / IMI 49137) TaxID=857340 RepID=A0A086TD65_HAPC1|nr:hypothetical protein ACRE_019290 [Hapsidospora chrysogenum ATCC 11550]
MSKWSTKPADHKVTRQRNNQRRHRQRVKDRIADLEARLEKTQRQLSQALDRVAELTSELDRVRRGSLPAPGAEDAVASGDQGLVLGNPGLGDDSPTIDPPSSQDASQPPDPGTTWSKAPCGGSPAAHDPASLSWATAPALPDDAVVPPDSWDEECCDLPHPKPGTSTTRCRDAYIIISQQNYRALDVHTIRQWLEPGFHGALHKGDGCRVDTEVLFALLDYISSG